MFRVLIFLIVVFMLATFPATWLLMLFLGNVGVNVSYWGAPPLGSLVSGLLSSSRSAMGARRLWWGGGRPDERGTDTEGGSAGEWRHDRAARRGRGARRLH